MSCEMMLGAEVDVGNGVSGVVVAHSILRVELLFEFWVELEASRMLSSPH